MRLSGNVTAISLGFNSDLNSYVNESLSPARRKLLKLAKEPKRAKNYQLVRVREGQILMKKDGSKDSSAIVVKKGKNLANL